jgi:L-ribulose-5-phosphate 4-epimerase
MANEDLREEVALANRLLHHYGLGAYQGHVSARVPGTDLILIRARPSVSLERVQPADLMLMDLDGNVVEAGGEYPDRVASWALHTEIYKARPEVNSVTHTHQKMCTVFGIAGRDVLALLHPPTASIAADPWPVYDETAGAIAEVEQGQRVAELLGPDGVACHLRNHGMVFVGTTVSKAVLAAADAEQQAEITWQAMLVGTPETIDRQYLATDIEKRFEEPKPDVRDGVARGEWGNQTWLDDHRDAAWGRGITL